MLTILPGLLIFGIGYLLRRTKVLGKDSGELLLKIVFYVGAPALAFQSIVTAQLSENIFVFPLAALCLYVCCYFIAKIVASRLHLARPSEAVFVLGSMIINVGFTLPFIILLFADYGVTRILLFDIVGDVCLFGWAYIIACKYGNEGTINYKNIALKLLKSPPLWGIVLGLLMRLLNVNTPHTVIQLSSLLGSTVGPLMLLSLGLYFEPKIVQIKPTVLAISIRMLGGLGVGLVLVQLFHLTGVDRHILLLAAASPVGFTSITFASLEKLDVELAASTVSISVLVGMVCVPLILWL
jgi:malate permease and related proteins